MKSGYRTAFYTALIFSLAIFCCRENAYAQVHDVTRTHSYNNFNGVVVNGGYEVCFTPSDTYSVKLTVDELLETYSMAYVKDGVLYIDMDYKSFPSDLKKALKGRNAIKPHIRAEVFMPAVNEVYLTGKSVLKSADSLSAGHLKIVLTDQARIESMNVHASTVSVDLSKESGMDMNVQADSISVNMAGYTKGNIKYKGRAARLAATGSAVLSSEIEADSLVTDASSSSEMHIKGKCGILGLTSAGMSRTDARALEADHVSAKMKETSRAAVKAKYLSVDMVGASNLVYEGNPAISVQRIISSTMTRSGDSLNRRGL